MKYQFKYLDGRPQIFFDTGERFYPSEPLPKDHLFEAGINFSPMLECNPEQLIIEPVNKWLNDIPLLFANKVITQFIRMGRYIRTGSANLANEVEKHRDWTVDEEGNTELSINISNMFVDLSEEIGDFDGLLNSMERFICTEIGTGRMSDNITELPLFDKNIRFTEKQMYDFSSFVANVGPVRRPWIIISTLFMELVETYSPQLIMLLRQHIRKHLNGTLWASDMSLELEAEFQFCEYLWYGLPFVDLYKSDLKIIDSVLDVFSS